MVFLIYNILLTFVLMISSPYFLIRALVQKRFRKSLPQRLGCLSRLYSRRPIWVHAASVGEVHCSIPLLKNIKKEFPHLPILLTTMTSTGNETANLYLPEADHVFFVPIDHPLIVRRAIGKIKPSLLLIAETELWPNLLRSCGKKGIPIILFNGRISKKSFPRYLFFKFFFKKCLQYISLLLMQTEEDRTRIIEIGGEREKTKTVGNLKFDQVSPLFAQEPVGEVAKILGLRGKEKILIAGSTHSGEEEILFKVYKELSTVESNLVLILAPRHLERLDEVEKTLKKESLEGVRKTSLSLAGNRLDQNPPKVILLDTMGELMSVYRLGTAVFIGGSLVPVGGHNPLEPLFFKKCVLFGPYMFNFSEIARRLTKAGGAVQVFGKDDLLSQLKRLLFDDIAREEVGERGYQFLQNHQGATERILKEIRPFLTKEAQSG